jgi:hypothetical protein
VKSLSSATLGSLAGVTLLLAAFGAGISARVTIYLILAAVRADARERFADDLRRSGVDR